MHCELVVPGLLGAPLDARLPALELLLARGRHRTSEDQTLEAWLQAEFALDEAQLPAGALTLLGRGGDPGVAPWVRADPVHLRVLRDRAVVVPAAAFALSSEEAHALYETLRTHFEGRLSLEICTADSWAAALPQPLEVPAAPALVAAGSDVVPGTPADALLTEVQMVLHQHPVNEAREARGEPAINSLWLWGAGALPSAARAPWKSVTSDDPLLAGLARLAGAERVSASVDATRWLDRLPEDGRHLVVLDALRAPLALADPAALKSALQALERDWFVPLLGALRASRIGMVTLHVPDSGLSVETIRGDLRRLWRRPRPLGAWVR